MSAPQLSEDWFRQVDAMFKRVESIERTLQNIKLQQIEDVGRFARFGTAQFGNTGTPGATAIPWGNEADMDNLFTRILHTDGYNVANGTLRCDVAGRYDVQAGILVETIASQRSDIQMRVNGVVLNSSMGISAAAAAGNYCYHVNAKTLDLAVGDRVSLVVVEANRAYGDDSWTKVELKLMKPSG